MRRNTDTGIAYRKRNTAAVRRDLKCYAAGFGEFERIGQQILENLLQPLTIGKHHLRCSGCQRDRKMQILLLRQRREAHVQTIQQTLYPDRFRRQFELAGFDLGNIENVVDQIEQIIARRINGFGKLQLLRIQIALGIIHQQFGQNQ